MGEEKGGEREMNNTLFCEGKRERREGRGRENDVCLWRSCYKSTLFSMYVSVDAFLLSLFLIISTVN